MKIKVTNRNGRKIEYEGDIKDFTTYKDPLFGDCINISYLDKDIKTENCGGSMRITGLIIPITRGTKILVLDCK